jgi:hypothetical protein
LYRDDLAAAHARIAALEEELARSRERDGAKIAALEAELARLREPPRRPEPTPVKLGGIHYHPPRTYVPLLRLTIAAIPAGLRAIRSLGTLEAPDNVLAWLALRLAIVAAWLVGLPIYYFVLLPWFVFLAILATPVLLPIVPLMRLKFSSERPEDSGWFHGEYSGDTDESAGIAGAVFITCMSTFGIGIPALLHLLG